MLQTFGPQLRSLRKEKHMKQTELAALLNVSFRQIQRYESSEQEPSLSRLVWFAEYFNVSVDFLLGVTNERRSFPEK